MKISPKTKISALIKANPEAIEVIAGIDPKFQKLRNLLLRKLLASRVTIAEAAQIGGTDVATFFEKLSTIGFEPDNYSASFQNPKSSETLFPVFLPENLVELDVREALETGNDPFNEIMAALNHLKTGQALKLINTFEPTPLISIVRKRGFTHFTEHLSENLVNTYFLKTDTEKPETKPEVIANTDEANFAELIEKYKGNLLEIDVRNLEMPLPMTIILETVPKLQPGQALFVHHRRVPQYLLPQLAEKGMGWAIHHIDAEEVKLLIYKK